MKNRLFLLIAFLSFSFSLFAQQKMVKGNVKDKKGEPIIGATIVAKGTTSSITTDENGNFSLNVPTSAKILLVSSMGMNKTEIEIKGGSMAIVLEENAYSLNEIVAIGYGTIRKKDLTGSVSSISEKSLRDIPVASVTEALTGKLPGVQITTTEGSPDAAIKIRVRGGGSITQSNTPLFIVDGFARDNINDISPSEILSIDILKDASSTAIYGSRGANGVILITTKTGQSGKITVNYTGYFGVKNITKKLDVLSGYEFAKKQYERALLGGEVADEYEAYFGSFEDIDLYKYVKETDWQDKTFGRTGTTQSHSISLTGGSDKLNYNASYNRVDDKAIMIMSDYQRDNANLKLNFKPAKWLKANLSSRFSNTIVNGSGANDVTGTEKSTSDSRVKSAVVYSPIALNSLIAEDDDADATASLYSPLVASADNNRYQQTRDYVINGGMDITLSKPWSIHSNVGWIKKENDDKRFYGLTSYFVLNGGAAKRDNLSAPAITLKNTSTSIFQNSNTLNFKKDNWIEGHNLSFILGQETYIKSSYYDLDDIQALPIDYLSEEAWANPSDGTLVSSTHYINPDDKLFSFFGRLNYDIEGKYLFAATFRADGSSKFAKGNQWGYFPSGSMGWRISDEDFMESTKDWLSNLKLRGSYGAAGNNNIDNAAYQRTYSASSTNYLPSSLSQTIMTAGDIMANPNLKWETTITQNLGLDYGFFNNRLSGMVEIYKNTTKDLLIKMSRSGSGYTYQWMNMGQTSNKGIEFALNAALIQRKDFTLDFSFNISANKNKVDNLGTLSAYTFNEAWTSMTEGSNSYTVTPGQPVGLIYGYVNKGTYSTDDFTWNGSKWVANDGVVDNSSIDGLTWGPGAMKLADLDGDNAITSDDRTVIGNTNPKHFGSFTFSSTYKAFDASLTCNWVYGNDIYNANKIEMSSAYYKYRNQLSIMQNAYSQVDWATGERITDAAALDAANANATIWAAPTGRYATTSWAVEDGSFLRVSNLTIGYSLPTAIISSWHLQKLRVYVSAYNLYTFTNYTGYDPEVDSRRTTPTTPGVDYSAYPKSRSFNFGVNITL
jgi:TonB-dependent starch-binding outer membrane protein SusC